MRHNSEMLSDRNPANGYVLEKLIEMVFVFRMK